MWIVSFLEKKIRKKYNQFVICWIYSANVKIKSSACICTGLITKTRSVIIFKKLYSCRNGVSDTEYFYLLIWTRLGIDLYQDFYICSMFLINSYKCNRFRYWISLFQCNKSSFQCQKPYVNWNNIFIQSYSVPDSPFSLETVLFCV